jgi:prepilin-type N-terminal cleavage/methylation domain-containing protein
MFTKRASSSNGGFTIVELVVVIVVIAILTVIATVAYNGVVAKSKESILKSDLKTVAKTLMFAKPTNNEVFPAALSDVNLPNSSKVADTPYVYTVSSDGTQFCVSTTLAGITWVISDAYASPMTGTCVGAVATAGTGVQVVAYVSKVLSLGHGEACQLKSSTQLYCWGYGLYGKLGNGSTSNASTPTLVTTSTGVMAGTSMTQVVVGADHVCAIASGAGYCWGDGSTGRFGNGTTAASSVPVAMTMSGTLNGLTLTDISVGAHKTCVVASDNWSYCMGENQYGQLGDGTQTNSTTPIAKLTTGVLSGLGITNVDARGFRSSCVIANKRIYCSGYNTTGGLGVGNTTTQVSPTAVLTTGVLNGKDITAVASGPWGSTRCALDSAGKVYCWGNGASGNLGNGNTASYSSPVAVIGTLATKIVKQLSVGDTHACALTTGNEIYCWGANNYGQLGDGTTGNASTPVAVSLGAMSGKTITDIAASGSIGGTYNADFTCAIASGETYCWGRNEFGNLGDGSTTSSLTPLKINVP